MRQDHVSEGGETWWIVTFWSPWTGATISIMSMLWLLFEVMLVVNGFQGDEDEWIDPTDMVNYDAASGRMRRPYLTRDGQEDTETNKGTSEIHQDQNTCRDCAVCERRRDSLQKELEEYKKIKSAEASEISCNPVFKRYLNKLLLETEKIGLPDDDNEVHYDAEVYVTKHDVTEIKKFLNGKPWTSGPLDDALSKLLVNFKHHDPIAWKWKFEDTFGVDLLTVLQFLACLVCIFAIIRLAWTPLTRPYRFLLFCFLISFGWNWVFLYKTAFAKRQANVAKLEPDKLVCAGVQKMDWKGSLFEWFRRTWTLQDDPCEKYYEALLVDPIWEVPPAKALMLTITTLITEPLKHIGQPISQFFRDLLKDLPWLLQFYVTLVVVVSVIAIWYFCVHAAFRYGLPRFLPDGSSRPPIAHHHVPYIMQSPTRDTFYQMGGCVDYQAGGDARHVPDIRKDTNGEQPRCAVTRPERGNNTNQHGVEDVMNWERAGVSNNGRGDNQLRRRRVPGSHCSGHTSDDQQPISSTFLSTEPQPLGENQQNAAKTVMEHNVAHQAGGVVGQIEGGDLQSKNITGLPPSNSDNRLYNEKRAGEKDVQNTGQTPEDPWTADRSTNAVPQHPSNKSATDMEPIDKRTLQEEKLENEESFIENVGTQAFNNLEFGENQRT
ncbi:chloride channel CLIC-like protein 1 isoform X2 [Pristis pectinata]|uniref:chloride channel CLIC-like protein 1 isoform X2 n=1 Tax=Pristis pectinata TaxID=685728 RepID=UPI00223E8ECB|nr:chloride channel CLIC-like protein 1 isoform X2 [Pristis pectinata]